MSVAAAAATAAKVAEGIGTAVTILWPLIQQAGEYIAGARDELPEVPGTLRSRLELERAKRRRNPTSPGTGA